jgi:multidrug efflux pump subunit AcrB
MRMEFWRGTARRYPFPDLNFPVLYVAQPYGGMSPAQMEGYFVYYYEYHFLYINGIESVEDKSIQGNGLLKLTFYPGTNMSEALAQTISYVNRARASMPPGTVSPFVVRFDAGTVCRPGTPLSLEDAWYLVTSRSNYNDVRLNSATAA